MFVAEWGDDHHPRPPRHRTPGAHRPGRAAPPAGPDPPRGPPAAGHRPVHRGAGLPGAGHPPDRRPQAQGPRHRRAHRRRPSRRVHRHRRLGRPTTTTTQTTAARDVGLATELAPGHDTTADALAAGLLSPAHAAIILAAGRDLPTALTQDQRQHLEATLVAQAQRFAPDQLRRIARRALQAVEPDHSALDAHENQLLTTQDHAAHATASLSFHDNPDGTVTGHFTLPTLAAATLRKAIDAITAPRRMRETTHLPGPGTDHTHNQTHDQPTDQPADRSFDWRHRRGLAFAELLEHLPTDHLHPKSAATVVVTIDHHTLTGALKAAHLDTGHTLTAGEARRLACTTGILPAVLGTGSVALDLGRENRLFTEPQRLAIGLAHDTCAADGCERPYPWCELHHREPWSHHGRTDLANAIPLCHYHHQRIHDHTYTHHRLPDGSLRFSRRS